MASGKAETSEEWAPDLTACPKRGTSRSIVRALAADVASGRLRVGDALPSQRALAERLGINFTTVTRAYHEARQQGLIAARVGQGTFVASGSQTTAERSLGPIKLTSNSPPAVSALDRVALDIATVGSRSGLFLTRHAGSTEPREIAAARRWLNTQRFAQAPVGDGRIAVAGGVRCALTLLFSTLVGAGGTLLVEDLTWPAVRALAAVLGLRLRGVAMDGEGLIPEALDEACRASRPAAIYCTPSAQNPTAVTMSAERRKAVAEVAARHDVPVIEDDVYGLIGGPGSPPPMAAMGAPGVIYVGGLAKSMSSDLRVAYVVHPEERASQRFSAALTASGGVAAPIEAALAAEMIESGTADAIICEIRGEMARRRRRLETLLGGCSIATGPEALHAWLRLPPPWSRADFMSSLQRLGVIVTPSDAFAVDRNVAPEAVRMSLGAPASTADLEVALRRMAGLLETSPAILDGLV